MPEGFANSPDPANPWPVGWWVRRVAETGSTNADLLQEGTEGAKHHTVLMADFQTAGRGRLDRTWDAVRGANLLVSILFRVDGRPLHHYTQIVGLAARSALRDVAGVDVEMKWPNDLLARNVKISGILAQAGVGFVVVGIGVNVGWAPDGAVCVRDLAPSSTCMPVDVLSAMLPHIDRLEGLSREELHGEYVSALMTIGQRVRVELAASEVIGTAVGVGEDGRLHVLDECAISHHIDTGDVVHLRPA
jgi:BirA family biotin operon repressor/biotin-[acetyl-CoA-carboxylase] ligase